jgi:Transglutaminase-like superfamily
MDAFIAEALLGLLAFDLCGGGRNFSRLHRTVSSWPVAQRDSQPQLVAKICRAMNYACIWYPKRALCLQRSAVITCLLRSHGVPARMVVGAQELPFKAHAWVEVDGYAVNERSDVQTNYRVLDRC